MSASLPRQVSRETRALRQFRAMLAALIPTSQATWSLSPGPFFILVPVTAAYVIRWRKVQAHPFRLVLFLLGIFTAAMAFFSPIDELGDSLLAMHMVQHLLLLDLAPILCLLGLTKAIFRPATKRIIQLEKSRYSVLLSPKVGVVAYSAGMWFWHWPAFYDAALRHPGIHVLEHLTFAVIGGVYWWHLISPVRDSRRLSGMGAVLYMATTKIFVGILGLSLTFIPRSIYPVYAAQTNGWGMTAQEDQALAGVIMAIEQSMIMGLALVWLVTQLIERSEKEQLRQEKFGDLQRAKRAAEAAAAGTAPPRRELY